MTNIVVQQEQILFLKHIQSIFEKDIFEEECLITDHSTLYDFLPFNDISFSKQALENGKYLFSIKVCQDLESQTYIEKEFEDEGVNEKERIVNLVFKIFGVDISNKFNQKLPELFLFISKNKTI